MVVDSSRRIQALVKGLIQKTRTGSLDWDFDSQELFELSLTRSTVQIRSKDGDGLHPYGLTILDSNGRFVEGVESGNPEQDYYGLGELFEAVSRSHRGVDEKLTEILGELGIDEPSAVPDPWGSSDEPPF